MEEKTIWDIDCPFCQRRLVMTKHDASINARTGMHYVRTRYACPHCDYWLTTEIPRKIAAQHVRIPLPEPVKEETAQES